jgi:exonuclease SbcC
MSLQEAVENARRIAKLVKPFAELGEALEGVVALDALRDEAKALAQAAVDARAQAETALAAALARVEDARAEAEGIVLAARIAAEEITSQARQKAESAIEEGEAKAKAAVSAASVTASGLRSAADAEHRHAMSEIANARRELADIQAAGVAAKDEVARAEGQLQNLRATIARLLEA